jgi:hypothetical protein
MSVASEIARLQNAKASIKTSIENKGVTVGDGTIDTYASKIDEISTSSAVLGTKTITANGTYKAIDDNLDGYSQVTVETSGVDINDYYNLTKKRTFGNITYYIKTIPLIDTSSYTNMESLFRVYESLESIPLLDTRNVTNMRRMCDNCDNLKTFPAFDTSKVTNFYNTFYFCKNLREYPRLDFSSANSIQGIFYGCYRYVKFNGLKNLGKAYDTSSSANNSNYRLDISNGKDGEIILATNIDHDSLMNVINDLYDIASKGVATQQLVLGSGNLAKLTAEEIQIATSRGWSVS